MSLYNDVFLKKPV